KNRAWKAIQKCRHLANFLVRDRARHNGQKAKLKPCSAGCFLDAVMRNGTIFSVGTVAHDALEASGGDLAYGLRADLAGYGEIVIYLANFHDASFYEMLLSRKSLISAMVASGCSTHGIWPAPSMISKREPFMSEASSRTRSGGVEPS